ncbi:hypothetical protein ABIA30_004274 [Mycobacterium sp. MAA66]|uniref:helix-turn-helix domain-containing protein n=1 Tax=Mycobacterium sp. MAA66 TaxID=3156297 RepID=UPI0035135DE7
MSRPDRPEPDERQRAVQAIELRKTGATYRAIAAELGYSDESGARKAVERLLSRVEHEGAAELRAIECERLDALTAAHWSAAIGGNTDASMIVLRVIDRRAKLLGLNAPQRVQVAPDELSHVDFAERMAALITELRPETLRQVFPDVPEVRAVFDAGRQTGPLETDGPADGESSLSVAHSGGNDGWSNIGVPTPVEHEPEPVDLAGIPDHVLAVAAAAATDDEAAAILARYRRLAS